MSPIEAFTTPTTSTLLLSAILRLAPSDAFTSKVSPSSFSTVPLTRTVCCAETGARTSVANTVPPMNAASVRFILFPNNPARRRVTARNHDLSSGREVAATDVDAGGLQRSIRFLGCRGDVDIGAGFEIALGAVGSQENDGIGADDDFLFAVLVFHG